MPESRQGPLSDREYYQSSAVRARVIEYCGSRLDDPSTCTAWFLIGSNEATVGLGIPRREDTFTPADMDVPLGRGVDLFRSVWDRKSTVAFLDIDYQNTDFPDHAFHNPSEAFAGLEPAFAALRAELARFGIRHVALMTGQGYHFAWSIADGGEADVGLRSQGDLPATLEAKYRYDHPFSDDVVPLDKGRGHAGLGLVLEYLMQLVLRRTYATGADLPAVATGLVVGSWRRGREAVSLDLSAYGDPLYMRYTRCAFSLYHAPSRPGFSLVCLPRLAQSWCDLLPVRGDLALAAEFAQEADASIPDASAGTARLIKEYLSSDLRRFHLYFASGRHDEPAVWPRTYEALDLRSFSPCVAWPLRCPSSVLADPANIQNVSRVLVSAGWHPRSVAGLIRSKFERDYGWGVNWLYYDAATRADFYVRLFCGLIATGLDDLRDFNCVSHQEKGYCPKPWCGFNLADYRQRLLKALAG
ncbi:MAG: hypothetical protein HYX95_01150 [Chloroflexi bacterium]|nr:hypothetical protein [Chloroflexota bacterium]